MQHRDGPNLIWTEYSRAWRGGPLSSPAGQGQQSKTPPPGPETPHITSPHASCSNYSHELHPAFSCTTTDQGLPFRSRVCVRVTK